MLKVKIQTFIWKNSDVYGKRLKKYGQTFDIILTLFI